MANPASASSLYVMIKVGGWWDTNNKYRGGEFIHGGLMPSEGFGIEKVVSKIVELTNYDRTMSKICFWPEDTDGKICFLKEDEKSKIIMDKEIDFSVKHGHFMVLYAVREDDPYLGNRKVVEAWEPPSLTRFTLSITVGGWWDKKNRYCGGEVIDAGYVDGKDFSVHTVVSKIIELTDYDGTMSQICFWPGGRDEKIHFLKEDMESKVIMDKEIAAAVELGIMHLYAVREDDPYISKRKALELGVAAEIPGYWSDDSSISSCSEDDYFHDYYDDSYDGLKGCPQFSYVANYDDSRELNSD